MAEVVTGEAVVLEVPCARFPSRMLALAIDLVIQFVLLFVFSALGAFASNGLDEASAAALAVVTTVLVLVGYPVIWETATRGRSPGKFALGLQVVSDDGGPERFRQALVRGLAGSLEIWAFFGAPALICSLLSARGKRLGDLFAGTFVIQRRLSPARSAAWLMAPPELAAWAERLELSGLTDQTAAMAQQYLARMGQLRPAARAALGAQIATTVSGQVSPPPPMGTPPEAYLGAVLAERRRREQARWARPGTPSRAMPEGGRVWEPAAGEGVSGGQPTREGEPAARPPAADSSAGRRPPHAGGFAPPA